jgi:hypothetical protein
MLIPFSSFSLSLFMYPRRHCRYAMNEHYAHILIANFHLSFFLFPSSFYYHHIFMFVPFLKWCEHAQLLSHSFYLYTSVLLAIFFYQHLVHTTSTTWVSSLQLFSSLLSLAHVFKAHTRRKPLKSANWGGKNFWTHSQCIHKNIFFFFFILTLK